MSEYPADSLCAEEGCGHRYDLHDIITMGDYELCGCEPHYFRPLKLAGGALTPEDERAAYERAMKGGMA